MESPAFGGESQRPELDRNNLESLFTFAVAEQHRLKKIVAEEQLPEAIDFLVEKLERFVSQNFDQLPELVIHARDVSSSLPYRSEGPDILTVRSEQLPLDSTDVKVFGAHVIRAVFYKFYRGKENDDLRMYVDTGRDPVNMPGGVFTPLLSIGVDKAEIRLAANDADEQFEATMNHVHQVLAEYSEDVRDIANILIKTLNNHAFTPARKLRDCSPMLAEIARRTGSPPHVIDVLLDVICIKLDLASPQNISVSQHHLPYPEYPRRAYVLKGPAHFAAVVPHLELVGETDYKELELCFLDESEVPTEVPVRYITDMRKQ